MKLFKGDVIDAAEDFSLILNVTLFPLKIAAELEAEFLSTGSQNVEKNPH